MPEWLHSRAEHIKAKNPDMPESEAFGIATQQSHALGKTPKGYGTSKAKAKAKKKFDTPKDDVKTADPGDLGKEAGLFSFLRPTVINPMIEDSTRQIVREELAKNVQAQKQSPKIKRAGISSVLDLVDGFSDELEKIANLGAAAVSGMPGISGSMKSTMAPKKFAPNHTQINMPSGSPVQSTQPVRNAPPVRG